jgi:hypothetical protein
MRNWRRDQAGQFFAHRGNSICHNGRKITEEISDARLKSLPDPAYSPDLSPCDCWLFGVLKAKVKDQAFQTVEEISDAIPWIWNAMSFEQLQPVFLNWMERLE